MISGRFIPACSSTSIRSVEAGRDLQELREQRAARTAPGVEIVIDYQRAALDRDDHHAFLAGAVLTGFDPDPSQRRQAVKAGEGQDGAAVCLRA